MTRSLGKSGILKFGIGLIALTVAASVQAKTLVYCSEGSPEGFNPQLFTSGTSLLKYTCALSRISATSSP
jgi:dipeptide transport system substrate-binding protein